MGLRTRRGARSLIAIAALRVLGAAGGEVRAAERGGPTDAVVDLLWGPDAAWETPMLGPADALVTVDLFLPIGSAHSARTLGTLLHMQREDEGLRLRFHPTPSTAVAERGQQLLWEVRKEPCFWPVALWLYGHAELLHPEQEPALLRALTEQGLAEARAQAALRPGVHREALRRHYRVDLAPYRVPSAGMPLLWINGRALPGGASEGALREAVDQAKEQALGLLRQGLPRALLLERLMAPVRDELEVGLGLRDTGLLRKLLRRALPAAPPARIRR